MQQSRFRAYVEDIPPWKKRFTRKFQTDAIIQIHAVLKAKGWTQKRLAQEVGCTQSQVSRVLSGRENLTLRTIARIEAALDEDILVVSTVCAPSTDDG